MAKTVLVPTDIAAKNIDSLNRSVIHTADVENGAIFQLNGISTNAGEGEVFNYLAPAAGDGLKDLWMAYSPEVVLTVSGNFKAKGIDSDPRDFTNVAGIPFDAYKIQKGDLIQITADGISGTKGDNLYAVATAGSDKLVWAAAAVAGVSYKLVKEMPIIIGNGNIGGNAVTAYILECVAIA